MAQILLVTAFIEKTTNNLINKNIDHTDYLVIGIIELIMANNFKM